MTEQDAYERAVAQAAELKDTLRRLALRHAEVEERAGEVHDDVARVHEQLGERSLLDPEAVRGHARAERERAAVERERAAPQG